MAEEYQDNETAQQIYDDLLKWQQKINNFEITSLFKNAEDKMAINMMLNELKVMVYWLYFLGRIIRCSKCRIWKWEYHFVAVFCWSMVLYQYYHFCCLFFCN